MDQIRARHVSPDGKLTFIVVASEDGDISLGFEGFPWHTHADILTARTGLPEDEATGAFIARLMANELIVAILSENSIVVDTWVEDLPLSAPKYLGENERIQYRYWDGRVISVLDGSGMEDRNPINTRS